MTIAEQSSAPFVLRLLSDDMLLAKFFRALGDPTRLQILQAVMEGEKNVTALVDLTGAPQGRVSSHLACLRWCGYVAARKEGRQVFYSVNDRRVTKLLELAKELVEDNCERIRSCTVINRGQTSRRIRRRRRGQR